MAPERAQTRRPARRAAAPAAPAPREVDKDLYLRMMRAMALHRAVEDRMVSMYRQGELLGSLYTGHWHEAIAVGTAAALRSDDFLAPLHRDLGAHLWRGMDPAQVMASFMGRATSPTGGRDGTLHYGRLDLNVYNPPSHIPDNFPVATGAAFAARYRGRDSVALAYCGDGSTGAGDFHEALNIAAVLDLACVFVVENNQFAYSTPLRLTSRSVGFAEKAAAYGMPGERIDGTDVVAVYEATARAVARGRSGAGPTLIEAVTMRMHGHAEHDSAGYVPSEMIDEWGARDPVTLFGARLVELGIADDDLVEEIRAQARQQALDARKAALAAPMAQPDDDEEARVYVH